MSLGSSTSTNFGGRVIDNQQGVKQFFITPSVAQWVYKRLNNGLTVQTPSAKKIPVLIENDLIVTGSIYNTSDERLKENISCINHNTASDLFTLNPILYSYKSDEKKLKHFGFKAQDVEKVFPELVIHNNNGYKTVNYQELIPIMVANLQSMQQQIASTTQAITDMQRDIDNKLTSINAKISLSGENGENP
jgi:hypothetical protein